MGEAVYNNLEGLRTTKNTPWNIGYLLHVSANALRDAWIVSANGFSDFKLGKDGH